MGGQTSYRDMLQGYPGMRAGFLDHSAKTFVNDTGAVRQVHDFQVDTALPSTSYQFQIDGINVLYISPALPVPTVTSVRDGLIAAYRALQTLEDVAYSNPQSTNRIRITAAKQGVGFTPTETDANLSSFVITANVPTISMPFGRAVVRRTAGANVTPKSAMPPSAAGQEFLGVLERIHTIVDPTNASLNNGAASFGQDLTVVHRGYMLVEVDASVTAGQPAFFRHTGAAADIGKFRADAAAGSADAVPGGAKFESTIVGAGIAVLSLSGP